MQGRDDTAVLQDILEGQLHLARESIAGIGSSPRDSEQKRRVCDQTIAGLTLVVGIVIAREWQGLDPSEGRRLRGVYADALNALRATIE